MCYSCSKSSNILHNPHCGHLIHIPREKRYFFGTEEKLDAAIRSGYGFCMDCSRIGRMLKKERQKIDQICADNQLLYSFNREDGTLDIVSRYDIWKIIVLGNKKKIFLYHKNTRQYGTSEVPGYHCQNIHSITLTKYFRSIVSHDEYRSTHPERKKRYTIPPEFFQPVYPVPVKRKFYLHHLDVGQMVTKKKKKYKSRKAQRQAERRSREDLAANRVVALIEQWESERIRNTCVQDEAVKWEEGE